MPWNVDATGTTGPQLPLVLRVVVGNARTHLLALFLCTSFLLQNERFQRMFKDQGEEAPPEYKVFFDTMIDFEKHDPEAAAMGYRKVLMTFMWSHYAMASHAQKAPHNWAEVAVFAKAWSSFLSQATSSSSSPKTEARAIARDTAGSAEYMHCVRCKTSRSHLPVTCYRGGNTKPSEPARPSEPPTKVAKTSGIGYRGSKSDQK